MQTFDYILPLVSVLVGLALADLAISANRLLRARRRVRWDGLVVALAMLTAMMVLNFWWSLYSRQGFEGYATFIGFLPVVASLLVLYFLCAAVLPDEVPADGFDLRAFYEENAGYVWTLFGAYVLTLMIDRAVRTAAGLPPGIGSVGEVAASVLFEVPYLILCGVAVAVRRRWVHVTVLVLIVGSLVSFWAGLRL